MKVYISGPMKGKPLHNFQQFEDVAKWLYWSLHWEVYSAHDLAIKAGEVDFASRYDYVGEHASRQFTKVNMEESHNKRTSMATIAAMDGFVLLDGWQESRGSIKEALMALWCDVRPMRVTTEGNGFRIMDLELNEDMLIAMLSAHHSGRKVKVA